MNDFSRLGLEGKAFMIHPQSFPNDFGQSMVKRWRVQQPRERRAGRFTIINLDLSRIGILEDIFQRQIIILTEFRQVRNG